MREGRRKKGRLSGNTRVKREIYRDRQTETDRDRDTETETQRQRHRDTDRQTARIGTLIIKHINDGDGTTGGKDEKGS